MIEFELIDRELSTLADAQRAEVLDFICFLKTRHPPLPAEERLQEERITDLKTFIAPYRRDFGNYVFNRDEANER